MNHSYNSRATIPFLIGIIVMLFFTNNRIFAQCNNLSLQLTPKNSTCLSNGSIKIGITGADAVNIDTLQFSVTGTMNLPFTAYPNDSITGLPAGNYSVNLRAFCKTINDYVITSATAFTSIYSSYTEMNPVITTVRNTLNCKYTGMIPITIVANTGAPPFNITMTSYPVAYTGATTFTTSLQGTAFEINNLPAGTYTFSVVDACSYTRIITATVSTKTFDFPSNYISGGLYSPSPTIPGNTTYMAFNRMGYYYNTEDYFYYNSNVSDYFEVAYFVRDSLNARISDTSSWFSDTLKYSTINFQLPNGITICDFIAKKYSMSAVVRIKGTNCTFEYSAKPPKPYSNLFFYDTLGCENSYDSVIHSPSSSYVMCFPYQWRIVTINGNDTTVIKNWTSATDYSQQSATDVPYGSVFEFRDNVGTTWSQNLSMPSVGISGYNSKYISDGITDSCFHSYIYLYVSNADGMPAGTKIKFISGPAAPTNTEIILTSLATYVYPFSTNYKVSEFLYLPAGVYKFDIIYPGGNCDTVHLEYIHDSYKLIQKLSYTTKETCGLKIYPQGQIARVYYDAYGDSLIVSLQYPYFRIYSSIPPGLPYEARSVRAGDSLFIPASGKYVLMIDGYYDVFDTITYVQTQFTLDASVTTAYVCQSGVGFIRVKGLGGSGRYEYELYDKGVRIFRNNTGIFNYGMRDSTYTIRLIDVDPQCLTSYDQPVTMIDLRVAKLIYSDSLICINDTIRLKCLTLGETTYKWTGPGIIDSNLQNQSISAKDVYETYCSGPHTYTVTVVPEGCGDTLTESFTLSLKNCLGTYEENICQNNNGYFKNGFKIPANEIQIPDIYEYADTLTSANGCDSIITLKLTVYPIDSTIIYDTVCLNHDYTDNGFNISSDEYQTAGDYEFYDTLSTSNSCDSVVILKLTILGTSSTIIYDTIYTNNSYTNHGFNISEYDLQTAGTYKFEYTLPNDLGCDSVITLELVVIHRDSICIYNSYMRHGFNITGDNLQSAGVFEFQNILSDIQGNDSIIMLELTVIPNDTTPMYDVVCQNNDYSLNGFNLSATNLKDTGTFIYERSLSGEFGCDSIIRLTLRVKPNPKVDIRTVGEDFCHRDFVVLQLVTNGTSYLWNTSSTENQISVYEYGDYSATVFLDECQSKAEYIVEPCPCSFYVPNTFTPNGDGINDIFRPYISCPENVKEYKLYIFDRWGSLIFSSFDYSIGWDGKYMDKFCKMDVYNCVVEYTTIKDEHFNKKLQVTLVR